MLPKNPNAPRFVFEALNVYENVDGVKKVYKGQIIPYNPSLQTHRFCYVWPFHIFCNTENIKTPKEFINGNGKLGIVLNYEANQRLNKMKENGWHVMSPDLDRGCFMMGYKVGEVNSAIRVGLKFSTGEVFIWYTKLMTTKPEERMDNFAAMLNMLTMLAPAHT